MQAYAENVLRYLLTALLFVSCIAPRSQTLTDEAYAQRYSTGKAANFTASAVSGSGNASLLSATVLALPALCNAIDASNDRAERSERCEDLFRYLSNHDVQAHEWQSYYLRCKKF